MGLVLVADEEHGEEGEEQEEHVTALATHFPGGDLGGVSLGVESFSTGV